MISVYILTYIYIKYLQLYINIFVKHDKYLKI